MQRPTAAATGSNPTSLVLLGAVLVLSGLLVYNYTSPCAGDVAAGGAGSWASNGISESSSGTLFRAIRMRRYNGERLFSKWLPPSGKDARTAPSLRPKDGPQCKNWAVTTTIFPPTKTVEQISKVCQDSHPCPALPAADRPPHRRTTARDS